MEKKIMLLDPASKLVERLFHQHHPYALWLATGGMVCLTHILAQRGFRPLCVIELITIALHVINCFEPENKAGIFFY
jgi:hypothetical protein